MQRVRAVELYGSINTRALDSADSHRRSSNVWSEEENMVHQRVVMRDVDGQGEPNRASSKDDPNINLGVNNSSGESSHN